MELENPPISDDPPAPRPALPGPTHLGDGAYASFDGFQIWLGANHHTSQLVALERSAFEALVRYGEQLKAQGVF